MAFHGCAISRLVKNAMAPVKKPPHDRQPHFLKAWRKYRKISQEAAAERAMISRSLLSKIEAGDIPYNQDMIERLAQAYGCDVADLVRTDPAEPTRIPIFDLPEGDAERVYEFIRALRISRAAEARQPVQQITTSAKPRRRQA